MPKVAQYYFKTAIVFLIIGICMGLQMSIGGNHNVIGAHAHVNLLGWVTMALFGSYLAIAPAKAEGRLAMIQYYVYTAGVVIITPSLYFMLLGNEALEPLVAIGSLISFAGVLLFAYMIFSGETSASRREAAAGS
ncbi:MAG: hypothetical protein NXI27_13860 [Alphaproteobacteria bacterium]|nr:hypothetical protein [Alphaproteobacteria bacterium]